MQSHKGLGTYKDGENVAYSTGCQFRTSRSHLFPVISELEDWTPTSEQAPEAQYSSGKAAQAARSEDSAIQRAHEAVSAAAGEWSLTVKVDINGWARVRRRPNRRYKAQPTFFVPVHMAKGILPGDRPYPLMTQVPMTERPKLPAPPSEALRREVHDNLKCWEDCVTGDAGKALADAAKLVARDEEVLGGAHPASSHRQRARCGAQNAEVRIGPHQYHPTVNKVLREGFTIDLTDGVPAVRELSALPPEAWGINAHMLREHASRIGWPDEELLFFLEYGFMDYSGNTPPICSFSPHQQKALRQAGGFAAQVRAEIDREWIGPPQDHPPSIPFQVRPGSLEPKASGDMRLVWNASWPAPGSRDSAVRLGDEWLPVAPNASTVLPAGLQFEWSAIETNNEIIAIMADGSRRTGTPMLGRTFDITKWFRQLAVATLDRWKCAVFAAGGFREDRRMQMGRRSSAHSAQRTTFLLTALLQMAAVSEQWGFKEEESLSSAERGQQRRLAAWSERRRKAAVAASAETKPWDSAHCLVQFSSFQDDITVVVLGQAAARDATEGVPRILQGDYGVQLSTKEAATKDFAQTFTSIGAAYDLSDPYSVRCHPRDGKLQEYRKGLESLQRAFPLVSLLELQRFAGLHAFMARFLEDGDFYCNSAYCCLRAGSSTLNDMRPVSRSLLIDAGVVLSRLQGGELAALTEDPIVAHPGHQGFSADASGSTHAAATGWGIHVQGLLAYGSWPAELREALAENKLSISPLELLAAAMAVELARQNRYVLSKYRRVVLRSDSESACAVVNSMRAGSAPMLEALRIFKEVQDAAGIRVTMQYLPSKENRIADDLSRGLHEKALKEAGSWTQATVVRLTGQLEVWYQRVLRAALQAARHTTTITPP